MSGADLDRIARDWVLREDAGPLPAAAARELQAWIESDPRHLGAYVRARAAWRLLDRARVLGQGRAPAPPPAPGRRAAIGAAALACAAAAAAVSLSLPATYQSQLGETRRIRLKDGSEAVLDADTRIEVRIAPFRLGDRRIGLVRGEAWFQVAHDSARPFRVRVGPAEVRAVGTAFSVARRPAGADVIVTEGVVEARTAALPRPVRVAAGDRAALAEARAHLTSMSPADLETELAWRTGRIGLNGDPLDQAVGRFNRFNRRKLVLASPELGRVSVVGWFRLDDPESFARAVAVGLKARIELSGDTITIRRLTKKADPE